MPLSVCMVERLDYTIARVCLRGENVLRKFRKERKVDEIITAGEIVCS